MRLTQEGFTDEQFRWCFWGPTGSGGPESDAANAGAVGGGSSDSDNDNGNDNDGGQRGGGAPPSVSADRSPDIGSSAGVSAALGSMGGGNGGQRGGGVAPSVAAGRTPDIGSAQGVMSALGTIGSIGDGRPTTSPAQRGGLYSSALASTQPTATVNAALSNMFGAPTSMVNGVPVTQRSPVSVDMPNYSPTDYGQEDLDKAIADLGRARDDAFSEPQYGIKLPSLIDPLGIRGRIATAVLDPTAALANQIAEKGIATIDGQAVPASQTEIGVDGLDVATTGTPVTQGGRVAAYDPQINAVFDTNPFSGLNPFGEGIPQNIQDLYSRANAVADANMERGGGGDSQRQPLVVPEQTPEEEGEQSSFPAFTPRRYEYQPYVGQFYTIPSRFTRPYGLLG